MSTEQQAYMAELAKLVPSTGSANGTKDERGYRFARSYICETGDLTLEFQRDEPSKLALSVVFTLHGIYYVQDHSIGYDDPFGNLMAGLMRWGHEKCWELQSKFLQRVYAKHAETAAREGQSEVPRIPVVDESLTYTFGAPLEDTTPIPGLMPFRAWGAYLAAAEVPGAKEGEEKTIEATVDELDEVVWLEMVDGSAPASARQV